MITEDYCSFGLSKLLREKGFDEPCFAYYSEYWDNWKSFRLWRKFPTRSVPNKGYLNVPTLQMAMKWLRDVHKIHIIAEPCLGKDSENNLSFNRWFWTILKEEGEYMPIRRIDEFETYELAIEDAIRYTLENLI